jgi:hypothetical protein
MLSGCGALHNGPRFTAATQAASSFDCAKITDAQKDERAQNQSILDRDLRVVDQATAFPGFGYAGVSKPLESNILPVGSGSPPQS